MIRKGPENIAELFQETDRTDGSIGGKPSLETMTEERSEQAKKATAASAEGRRNGANQRLAAADCQPETPHSLTTRMEAMILADQVLNRLLGYARKGSRKRNYFYRRDLHWITDVLLRMEYGEPDPLRPEGE